MDTMNNAPVKKQNIFGLIRKSVYSPEFYNELRSKPFSFSIRYFLGLNLILALVFAVVMGARATPSLISFVNEIGPAVMQSYPEELEIVIKNGKASSNVIEPYGIEFPKKVGKLDLSEGDFSNPENLIVIDTKSFFDLEKFQDYKTAALLSQNSIAFMGKNGRVEIQPLKDFPDFFINRSKVYSWVSKLESFGKFLPPIAAVLIFIGFFIFFTARFLYLFIAALLIFLIIKIKKLPIGYGKCYQIGLHVLTAGVLLDSFLRLFIGLHLRFLITIIMLVAVWFNMSFKQEANQTARPVTRI